MASKRFSVEAVFRGIDKISKPAKKMSRSISRFVQKSNRQLASLGRKIKQVGSAMGSAMATGAKWGGAAILGLTAAAGGLVREFSKIEDAEAMFTPLLGSAEKATKMVDELNKTAASTPFQFENLAGVANQLLPVMNGDIQNTIKTMRMLGDTAGGNAQKLETITRGYTKAMLKGKVDLESLNMIAEAGVPIFQDLAKVLGVKVGDEFFKAISAGKVKTKDLTKALQNMTSKGGIFFKGMEIASKTTTGVMSTMRDNISLAAGSLGKILAPKVKDYANKVTETAKSVKEWVKANEGLLKSKLDTFLNGIIFSFNTIVSVGKKAFNILKSIAIELFDPFSKLFEAFKNAAKSLMPELKIGIQDMKDGAKSAIDILASALKMLATAGTKAFEFIAWASPFLKPFIATLLVFKGILITIGILTKLWAIKQAIVNAVMAANPIGLIVIAVAALIAGIVLLVKNWDTVVVAIKSGAEKIWTWFSGLLDNPFFAALGTIFLPFITVPALIFKHWEPIGEFFENLWAGILSGFDQAMGTITKTISNIKNLPGIKSALDLLGVVSDEEKPETTPRPVTPAERITRSMQENTDRQISETTEKSTLTIRDETGKAELKQEKRGKSRIKLATSGAV